MIAAVSAAAVAAVILLGTFYGMPGTPEPEPYVLPDKVEGNGIPSDVASANNEFALNFYKNVTSTDTGNMFFSPLSMYTAYSILYEGSRSGTEQEIRDVFGMEQDPEKRHISIMQVISDINRDDPHATLVIANALWLSDHFNAYDSYTDIARDAYAADVDVVNFGIHLEGTVEKINQWASNNTRDTIKEVVTKDDLAVPTQFVITNAVYLNATWTSQFTSTWTGSFLVNGTESVDATMMNVDSRFGYMSSDDVRVLQMPYVGSRLSMMIILPDDKEGVEDLGERLSMDMIEKWRGELVNRRVDVSIPKFDMATKYNLKSLLTDMGMELPFSKGNADLSGIGVAVEGPLYVSHSSHDAFVSVTERGTVAGAVTVVVGGAEDLPPQFVANYPFIFIIQDDESGTILFMGRLSDPS